jgi:hypothetical protein
VDRVAKLSDPDSTSRNLAQLLKRYADADAHLATLLIIARRIQQVLHRGPSLHGTYLCNPSRSRSKRNHGMPFLVLRYHPVFAKCISLAKARVPVPRGLEHLLDFKVAWTNALCTPSTLISRANRTQQRHHYGWDSNDLVGNDLVASIPRIPSPSQLNFNLSNMKLDSFTLESLRGR